MHTFYLKFLLFFLGMFLILLLYTFFIDSFIIPHCNFEKIQPDLSVVCARELNFILHLEIFVHYDGQLRASHLILDCVPSYTNYQDSLSTLTIGSPLLSYFNVQLLEFLPHGLTCDKVKHQGPRRVRQGLLELIHYGSADIIFQGRAMHIPVETPILDDHSSIQKVFGRPTSLYKVVFSMTNVISIYDSF